MNRYLNMLLPLGVLCILATVASSIFWFVLVIAASFGFQWPFSIFKYLGLPALSIAIPVIGMLLFVPFARWMAVEHGPAKQKGRIEERKAAGKFHLRPA